MLVYTFKKSIYIYIMYCHISWHHIIWNKILINIHEFICLVWMWTIFILNLQTHSWYYSRYVTLIMGGGGGWGVNSRQNFTIGKIEYVSRIYSIYHYILLVRTGHVERDLDLMNVLRPPFLHSHSWLNLVDEDDWWGWGWLEKNITSKKDQKHRECGQRTRFPTLPLLGELQTRGGGGGGGGVRVKSRPKFFNLNWWTAFCHHDIIFDLLPWRVVRRSIYAYNSATNVAWVNISRNCFHFSKMVLFELNH